MENGLRILECADEIERCFCTLDETDKEKFHATKRAQAASDKISVLNDVISFRVPETLQEASIAAALLVSSVNGSTVPDEGEFRDLIERLIENLATGLQRMATVADPGFKMPSSFIF